MPAEVAPSRTEKDTGERIKAQVHGRSGSPIGKRERLPGAAEAPCRDDREGDAAEGAERKQRPRDNPTLFGRNSRGQSDQAPNTQKGEAGAERGLGRRRHNEGATQVRIGL